MMLCYNEEQAKLREAGEDRNYRGYEYFIKSVTVQYFHSYGQKRNRREK